MGRNRGQLLNPPGGESISKASMSGCNSSMQLTRGADYAVRVMVHLATLPERKRALLPTLAKATETPESFLSKVLQALARAKLISSRRGQSGGFQILARGRRATMREVIEAVDGPLHLNVCMISDKSCVRQRWCLAHPVWVEAEAALMQILTRTIIADLASQAHLAPALAPGLTLPGKAKAARPRLGKPMQPQANAKDGSPVCS